MNDYSKYDFYNYKDANDGIRHYFIKVNKQMIEVSKDVYYVCYNSYRKQLRDNIRDQNFKLFSFDAMNLDGHCLLDKLMSEQSEVEKDERIHKVLQIMNTLSDEDKALITELMINEKEEKEIAEKYHIARQTVNKKKKRIIKKIINKMKKNYE